jgi:hypothetical protein
MNSDLLKRPPTAMLFFALFCTLFSVIFNYTLSIMASPYIVADLGGSNSIATYTVSLFAPDWIAALLGVMALTGLLPLFLIHKRLKSIFHL